MSCRAHIHQKHEIAYGDATLNAVFADSLKDWLYKHGAGPCYTSNEDTEEWEVSKEALRAIPESAYDEPVSTHGLDRKQIHEFVQELLNAPTGEYAWVSWF